MLHFHLGFRFVMAIEVILSLVLISLLIAVLCIMSPRYLKIYFFNVVCSKRVEGTQKTSLISEGSSKHYLKSEHGKT